MPSSAAISTYLALTLAISIAVVLRASGATPRHRAPKLPARCVVGFALFLTILPAVSPALPDAPLLSFVLPGTAQAAEVVSSPEFIDVAVMPNGNVGMIFMNGAVPEVRFKRYFAEQGLDPSVQLSTAAPWYPQIATFQGNVIAAYVETRSGANQYHLQFRVSADNGATWGPEFAPFGSEVFDTSRLAPLLVTSRDGTTLYVFTAGGGSVPMFRSTQDPTLATWTTPAAAGDATMHVATGASCGDAGECTRMHNFEFTETQSGQWVYVTGSTPSEEANGCGRLTQVGTLAGSWSSPSFHGNTCNIYGAGGGSRATTFIGRDGSVYYVRALGDGSQVYYQKSTDGGLTWQARTGAYSPLMPAFTVGSPVGLYVPGYTRGEYIWYAGFGGVGAGNTQNAVRVIPLFSSPRPYGDTGTARLFGSLGGDWDFGTAYPYTFGARDIPTGIGAYKTSAEDLSIPGRLLNLSLTRSYDSADTSSGTLGPGWTHSFDWSLVENDPMVEVRRGDGRRDVFARQPDGSYAPPPNVFDVLTKNPDGSFTLTLKNQTQYEFTAGVLMRIHEPAGNQLTLGYAGTGGNLVRFPVAGTAAYTASRYKDIHYLPDFAANGVISDAYWGEISWSAGGWTPGDWWKVSWSSAQSLNHIRLWDRSNNTEYFGQGHILFSDGSTLEWSGLPNDCGSSGEYFLELNFPRKSGITWFQVISDSGGYGEAGLAEVEAYDDATPMAPGPNAKLRSVTDTAGRTATFAYTSEVTSSSGTNVASQRTYTESVAPSGSYPDSGGELTDGNLGNPTNSGDASWQGHYNLGATPLDITIDLGSVQRVGVVRSYHYEDVGAGIIRPASIEAFTSTDNIQFTSRGSTVVSAAVNDGGRRWRYELDLSGLSARWVRLRITAGGAWLFTSETQVFAEGAAPITRPFTYGDRLASVVDPIGRTVRYGYDQNGRLTRVVDKIGNASGEQAAAHSWHYTYDGVSAHIASVVDPDGRVRVANTYNSEGRLATQTDGAGNTSSFGYALGQTTVSDPRGHTTTQNFDGRWRLTSQTDDVDGSLYALQYFYEDAWSNLTAAVDRNGNRTDYTYDGRGNVLTKLDPQIDQNTPRYLTQYQYDTKNNLTQITDARGFVTTNTFDPTANTKLSTQQQITKAPDTFALSKWEYADAANPGLPTKIISPRGNTGPNPDYAFSQALSYDAQGDLTQRIDADGNATTFGYDGVSRQTTMVDADGYAPGGVPAEHTWTTVYDENDRVTQVTDPLTHSTFTDFDGAGDRTSLTDRNGNVTVYAYDGAARLASVQQTPDGVKLYTTTVTRDGNGNATAVAQDSQGASGNVTVVTDYGYDPINRLTGVTTHPSAGVNLATSYLLDGNGNALSRTTADGVTTLYSYDALSRLTAVSATGLATIGYGYDEQSHRTSMSDGTGSSSYSYDGLGRLTQAAQPSGTLGYGYDLDSNRTVLSYPSVGDVTYSYSNAGRLGTVTDWSSRQSSYTYSATGLAKTVTVPGGMTTTYTYDNAQRLTALANTTAAGTVLSDTYALDAEGNRTAIDETATDGLSSVKVNSDTGTATQDHPAAAIGVDSAGFLIWDDQRNGSTNSDIYFALRDPATGTWGTNVKVNTDTTTRNQTNPAISVDSANNAYAVWQDDRDGTSHKIDTNIYSSTRSASSGAWSTPNLKVNDDSTGNPVQRSPRIAGTAAGAQTAVWVDYRASQLNIYSSTLAVNGSAWAANLRVTDNTSSAVVKDFPDVAVGTDGTSYAVWQDSRNGNPDI